MNAPIDWRFVASVKSIVEIEVAVFWKTQVWRSPSINCVTELGILTHVVSETDVTTPFVSYNGSELQFIDLETWEKFSFADKWMWTKSNFAEKFFGLSFCFYEM